MRTARLGAGRESLGAIVLALAVPLLFLHERYQPTLELDWQTTSFEIRPSDLAVLLVVIAAIVSAARLGSTRLGAARILWFPGIALVGLARVPGVPPRRGGRPVLRGERRQLPQARRVRAARPGRSRSSSGGRRISPSSPGRWCCGRPWRRRSRSCSSSAWTSSTPGTRAGASRRSWATTISPR